MVTRYNRVFTWLKCQNTKDSTFGQVLSDEFAEQPMPLWGQFVINSASKQTTYDSIQERENATLRLRQFPPVSPTDRLVDKQFSEVWIIDGVYRVFERNETVLAVHKFAQQEGT